MSQTLNVRGVRIMLGNTKLGRTMHVNLPPPRSCDTSLPCFRGGRECYAMKFYGLRANVRKAWDANWHKLMTARPDYFDAIYEAVRKRKPALFRWHSAGDIPDADYLKCVVGVADWCPDTAFMVFTKKYDLIAQCPLLRRGRKPANLTVVLSMWPGVKIPASISRRFPKAWMLDPKRPDPRIPATARECGGGCDTCGLCWHLKPGQSVVFHKH